jgi:meiosis-specific transcription factor NDT80
VEIFRHYIFKYLWLSLDLDCSPYAPSVGQADHKEWSTQSVELRMIVVERKPENHLLPDPKAYQSSLSMGADLRLYSTLHDGDLHSATYGIPSAFANHPTSSYEPHNQSPETPPFGPQEIYSKITDGVATVMPLLEVSIEKGFFFSADHVWTCYRRNFFAVKVSYCLTPWINSLLYLNQENGQARQVQSVAVSLSAVLDGSEDKQVEITQHGSTRNKGPQIPMKKKLLSPTPPREGLQNHSISGLGGFHQSSSTSGPQLPLQYESGGSQLYSQTSHESSPSYQHVWERMQFKSATASSGKRGSRQSFRLNVELWANVQDPREPSPRWIKVTSRASCPLSVRGRAPSRFQHEGTSTAGASRDTKLDGP